MYTASMIHIASNIMDYGLWILEMLAIGLKYIIGFLVTIIHNRGSDIDDNKVLLYNCHANQSIAVYVSDLLLIN